jgi:hypothetical protein
MKRALYTSALTGLVVVGVVVACDNVAGPRSEKVSLSLQVPRTSTLNADVVALQSASDPITIIRDGRALRIDAVSVEFSRVDLQRADDVDDRDTDVDSDSEDSDRDSDQRDNIHLRGPFTVDLPLQGGVITPVAVDIPFGTFDEVKLHVANLRICGAFDANRDGDFADAGEEFTGAVGKPCVAVPLRAKLELDLDPPFVVDQTTDPLNITVRLEPARFFVDRDGSLIDPRALTTDKRLLARFRARIRAAIRAFEDANRNGEDDRDTDSEHHGRHG